MMSVFRQAFVCLLVALPAVAQSQAFTKMDVAPAPLVDQRNPRVLGRIDICTLRVGLVLLFCMYGNWPVRVE